MKYAIGIDIGSTCAKAVVLNENKEICFRLVQPTGWSSVDTAGTIREILLQAGFDPETIPVVATGYGRVAVPYAKKTITEITCHARGACRLFDREDLTVIDIGGQDTKIISVRDGMVQDFLMNDKCSAGTGRFLEVMANTLALRPDELCDLARQGGRNRHQLHVYGVCRIGGHFPHRSGRKTGKYRFRRCGFGGAESGISGRKADRHCGNHLPYRRPLSMRVYSGSTFPGTGKPGGDLCRRPVCRCSGCSLEWIEIVN